MRLTGLLVFSRISRQSNRLASGSRLYPRLQKLGILFALMGGMEVLTVIAVIPASFGLALLLQFGFFKAVLWALHFRG